MQKRSRRGVTTASSEALQAASPVRSGRAATAVNQAALHQATHILGQLPAKEKTGWSLKEAIALLKTPIQTALDKGYSREEITDLLSQVGIHIAPSSLKYYLNAAPTRSPSHRNTSHQEHHSTQMTTQIQSTTPSTSVPSLAERLEHGKYPGRRQQVEAVIAYLIEEPESTIEPESSTTASSQSPKSHRRTRAKIAGKST